MVMMSSPLVFMDTESTGLRPDDEVWEYAGRRRNTDGTTDELHIFISHDVRKAEALPASFYRDYRSRFPARWQEIDDQTVASRKIQEFTMGAHIVGAVPSFDTEKLGKMMRAHDIEPKWNYHLCDVENVVVGFLAGRGQLMPPPWNSDDLSHAVGVDPAKFARHTALGDVLWVEAQWDAVMSFELEHECPF
jgi:hypothetical protein